MSVFSTNQVRQLYVVTDVVENEAHVIASDPAGKISVKTDKAKTHLYFEYKGADNLMRSDLIPLDNIIYAKATKAEAMAYKPKTVTVSLDKSLNSGNPVAGQDYILRLAFKQFIGMSDEDQYFKYGMVHAYAGMTADTFYKTLALSLAKNFSREVVPLVKIEVHSPSASTGGNFKDGYMEVTPYTKDNGKTDNKNPFYGSSSVITDIDGVRITELEQPWRLGVMPEVHVDFVVQPVSIIWNGDEANWATVEWSTNGTVNNGKNIADLEYFCMGERGDVYRGMCWPNNIHTTYLVDPTKAYNTFDIHYSYIGSNESVQKSEKDITLVCDDATKLDKVIEAFNTATGLNVAKVSED